MVEVMEALDPEVGCIGINPFKDYLLILTKVGVDSNHHMDPQQLF